MDHYPSQEELRWALDAYASGRDTCHDREVLALAGGPGYQHLDSCGCDSLWSVIGSIFDCPW